jgi:16S rRNA (cytosine1402-N4)-methyltransferase
MQLDQPERGFAYSYDAPLDMRMDPTSGQSAADLVNGATPQELARILRDYGDERFARRIARAIELEREREPFTRTERLADVVRTAIPAATRRTGGHPAKRTFQALRIAVNDELGMLDRGLDAALALTRPGGRIAVIAFHSLEDRMVKRRFESWVGRCVCPPGLPVCGCGVHSKVELLTRKAVRASEEEQARNPRAASALLRAVRVREHAA